MANAAYEATEAGAPRWRRLQQYWGWLLALGIVWMVAGVLAIVVPFAAALALELVLGAALVVGGIAQMIQAWRCRGADGMLMQALGGALALILGGLLLFYPLQGLATLTLLLSAFFVVQGAFKVVAAVRNRGLRNWGWLLISGVLGIAVGLLIWLGWPASSLWALGLLAGIELIFGGVSLIFLALGARQATS